MEMQDSDLDPEEGWEYFQGCEGWRFEGMIKMVSGNGHSKMRNAKKLICHTSQQFRSIGDIKSIFVKKRAQSQLLHFLVFQLN